MPRNSAGVYELPEGNPVISGTIIESIWANTTMEDIADALTASLPRNGTAPMVGPLTLANSTPTKALHAASKGYVDKFLAYSSGMPIGFIAPYGGGLNPGGWLLCDGSAVSRTTYPDLFAAIGTIYGAGDGVLTFNLPDLRNEFIRGLGGSRTVGSKQAGSIAAHNHAVTDPGHTHPASMGSTTHNHTLNLTTDQGGAASGSVKTGWEFAGPSNAVGAFDANTTPAGVFSLTDPAANQMGVDGVAAPSFRTLQINLSAHTHNITGTTADGMVTSPTVTVGSAQTGVTTDSTGGAETVPQNVAMKYYIKAVQDATPPTPETLGQRFLGFFDASPGLLPQAVYPTFTYLSGDFYEISVGGDIYVFDPVTGTGATTTVAVGDYITWVTGGTDPEGWYHTVYAPSTNASNVSFAPAGNIGATNVQAAIEELDAEKAPASAATALGTSFSPYGGIQGTNVQVALQELDDEKASVASVDAKVNRSGDTMTGPLVVPWVSAESYQIGVNPGILENFYFDGASNVGTLFLVRGTIGETGGVTVFTVDSSNNAIFAQDVTAFSDERLKEAWKHLDQDLVDRLGRVIAGTYTRRDSGQRQIGVSAQSLQSVMPEAVREGADGMLSVAYGNAALAACVALAREVTALKRRVEQLEGML